VLDVGLTSILKMEAVIFSEISVNFIRIYGVASEKIVLLMGRKFIPARVFYRSHYCSAGIYIDILEEIRERPVEINGKLEILIQKSDLLEPV
jgi:hypothetical protein